MTLWIGLAVGRRWKPDWLAAWVHLLSGPRNHNTAVAQGNLCISRRYRGERADFIGLWHSMCEDLGHGGLCLVWLTGWAWINARVGEGPARWTHK